MGRRVGDLHWETLRDSGWQRPVLRRGWQSRPRSGSLYEDSQGNLWAGAATGLWRWKPGPPKLYPMPGAADQGSDRRRQRRALDRHAQRNQTAR